MHNSVSIPVASPQGEGRKYSRNAERAHSFQIFSGHRFRRFLFLCIALLTVHFSVQAQNSSSIGSGNWNNPAIWLGGLVPDGTNPVFINSGHTVTLVANTVTTNILTVTGTLNMAGFNMTAGSITGSGTIRSSSGTPSLTVGTDNQSGTFGGIIGNGAITFVKVGTGVLGFSADNTYTGNTNIQAGALRALGNNVFGTVGSIVVSSGAALQIEGGITLNRNISINGSGVSSTGAILNNGGENTLSGTVTMTGPSTLGSQGGTMIISTTLAGGVHALTFNGSGNFSLPGSVTGSGLVTKTGSGTLTITTAKTYTGGTTVNQGAINVQHANALSTSGAITVSSGGALQFQGGITFSRPMTINGTGTSSTGAIRNIDGTNTLSGLITLGSASKLGSDNGTLVLSAATTISSAGHALTFGGNSSINVTGALSLGAGSVSKENNGTTTLFVSNTYTGGTTMNSGILAIRNASALGASGTITVTSGASLQLENNITVSRVLNINGNGFGNNGAIRSDGNNTISSTVQLDGSARIYSDNGTLTLSNATAVNGSGLTVTFGGNSTITANGSLAMGSGGMTKFGNGTLTLNAASTYTGTTTISTGTVIPTNMSAFGTSGTIVINSSGTLQLQGGVTFARPIELSSSGSSSIGGIRSLSGDNTITSLITLTGNCRINSDVNTLTFTGANVITGTNQTLTLGGAGSMVMNRAISHTTGGLTKTDAGTVTLNIPNTYTGTTTVSGGILRYGTNNIIATGDVNVNGGTLDIQGFNDTVGQITVSSGEIIGTGTLSSSVDFNFSGGTINIILSGNVGLVKSGSGTLVLTGANTFTGQVWIQNGVLSVASLNRVVGGSASSNLGVPGSVANGTIRLGDGGSTGRLEYTGAAFTTDRVIELAGTSGGGEIRHNGSGALVFTANMVVTGAGNKDFTLGGSNNAFNEFVGNIVDFNASNRTNLVVNGGGFWSLPNAKGFSGDTDIGTNNTILHIENSLSLGTGGANRRITINNNTRLELVSSGPPIVLDQEIYLRGTGGVGSNACLLSVNGNNVLNGTLYMTSTTRIDAEADSLTFNGSPFAIRGNNNSSRTLTLGGNGQMTFVGEFSQGGTDGGAGSLTKVGNGLLHLIGARTSSGTFTMNAGSLLLGADERLENSILVSVNNGTTWDMNGFSETVQRISSNNGNSTITNNGAAACTLILDNATGNISTFSGRIDDGTNLINLRVRGVGTQRLSGTNSTYTGTTTVNDGILELTGSLESYGVTSAIGRGTAGQPIEITGGGELRINRNQTNTVDRAFQLTGPGIISKYNGGTMTLSGNLTSANFPLTLYADNSRTAVFSGNISLGTGTLTKLGPGLWELGGSGNTYSGTTTISGGTLRIGHPNAIPNNSPVVNNATLDLNGNSITMASLAGTDTLAQVRTNVGGTATITFSNSSGDITYSGNLIDGTGTLAIVKGGAYTQRLGGVNTYTGSTTINGGLLKAVSATAISAASDFSMADVAGAILDVTGFNNTIGALRGGGAAGGNVLLGTATLRIGSNNLDATYGGTITGVSTGGIEKVGTGVFTMTRNPDYTGLTIVSNGTLRAGADLIYGGVVSINSGALFDCNTFQSSAFYISFNNLRQLPGSWGSTNSPALNQNNTYFVVASTGTILAIDGLENGYWLGTTSNNWFTASNWHNNFIPNASTKAVIEYVAINNPVIGGTATCEDLEIFPDATVTISGSNVLDVHGDFLNYGTFVPNSSTVNFRKASGVTQVVTRPTVGPFANLQYFGTGTCRLSSNLPVPFLMSGALITSAGGTIDLNGKGLDCGGIAGDGLITNSQPFSVEIRMDNSAGTLTFSGTLQNGSGTVALQKLGTATQIMEGNSTYSGGTTISGGTVWARTLATALGTGTITMNGTAPVLRLSNTAGSPLNLNRNLVVSVNAEIIVDNNSTGAGAIHGMGTLSLNAASLTITGGANVNSGIAGVNFGATTHTVAPTYTVSDPINGGTTRLQLGALTGGAFTTTFAGNGDVQQSGAWAINPAASTNAILYQGTGTLTLSQNNNMSQFVTLSSGQVIATSNANALGNNSTVQLNGGQLILQNNTGLAFNRPVRVLQNSIFISDRTTAGAGVTHTLGTVVLVSPTNNVQMSAGTNVTSGIAAINTGTFQLNTTTNFTTDTLTALNVGGFVSNNTLTKTGAGQLGIIGSGTRSSGTFTLSQGILRLEDPNGLNVNNATLNLDQGQLQLANNSNSTFNGTNVVVRGSDVGIVVDRTTAAATAMVHTLNQLSWNTNNLELGVFRGSNITGTEIGTVRVNNMVQNTNNRTYNYNLRPFARFEMGGYDITNNTTVNSFGAGTLAQIPGTSINMSNTNATFNQTGGGGLEFSGPNNRLNGNINIDSGELRVALNTQQFRTLNLTNQGRVNPGSNTCFALSMFFDGVRQSPRLYGSTASPAQFQDNNRFSAGSTGMLGLKGYLTFVTQPIGGRSSLLFASPPVVQVYDSLDVLIDNPDNTSPVLAFLSQTDAGGRGRLRGDSVALMVNDRATFDSLRIGGRIDSIYRIAFIIDSLVTPALESGNITVTPGPIFPGLSSVIFSLDTAIANGLDSVFVTVTLSDIDSNGIANEPVSLTQDSTKQSEITVTNFGVSDPNGIAVFKVSATKADSIDYFAVVEFQDDEPFQDSARVYFIPGPPYRIQVFNPPYSAPVNTIFFPDIQITIFDSTNNQMWTDTNQVTLSLIPGGALDGITTQTEVGGVVTFANMSVSSGGTFFMRANVGSVSDTTLPFDIIENYYTGGDGDGHDMNAPRTQSLEGTYVLQLEGSFVAFNKLYDGTTAVAAAGISVDSLDLKGLDPAFPNVSIDTVIYGFLSPSVGDNKRVVISGAQLDGADTSEYIFTLLESPQGEAKILGPSYFGEDGRGEAAQRSDTLFLDGVKAVPDRIVFVDTPNDQIANTDFQLRAQILSADDRIIPFGAAQAILGFFANPSSANLSGTTSQPFTGGEAIFDSMRINLAGSGYQLSLEPGSPTHALDTAVSPPFDVYAVYNGGEGRGDSSLQISSRGLDGFIYDGWVGASSDWHTASNWSSQLVPRDTSRILISTRPNQPVLFRSGTPALNGFTLASAGQLTLYNDAVLTIDSGTTSPAADGPLFLLEAGSSTETRDNSRIVIQPNTRYVNRSDSRPLLESRQWIRGVRGWRQLSSPVATTYADFLDSLETQGYTGAKFDSLQPNVLWFAETDTGTTLQSWRQPTNASDSVLPGRGHYVFVFDGAGYPSAVTGGGNYADTLPVLLTATGREPDMSSGFDYTELTYTPRALSTQADTAGGNTFFLDENVADAGWNLLGNPTPSVLHWDEPGAWTKQNLDNTVYIWDPSFGNGTGGYRFWNGTIGNINDTTLERGLLAPYQAFWVHANAASPLLSFTHDAKSDTSQSYISRTSGTPPNISMRLTGAGMEANSFVSFSMDGITGPDVYDAYQLEAYNDSWLMLYTQSSVQHRKPLVINHLPEPREAELAIPLHLSAARNRLPISGNYSLSWTVDASWPADWGLALMDHHNEKVIPMQERQRYDFSYDAPAQPAFRLQADAEGFRSPQGVLHAAGNDLGANPVLRQQREPERPFTIVLIPNYDGSEIGYRPDHAYLYPPAPNPFTYETTLAFYLPREGQVRIEVSDMFGRSVRRVTAQAYAAGTHELLWSAGELAPGTYLIRLVTDDFVSTQKAVKVK